ncbi:MAG: uracil-DNA glycosylase [Deltaproteobacteria bacterium]|nr:MAG: uracil-DNA glycosylase [Deltaproteobacteria bacterium]
MTKDYRRNCFKCTFFYVTWDVQHPNGCKAMGFKTKQLPSVVVFKSSGKPCELYKKKILKKPDQS